MARPWISRRAPIDGTAAAQFYAGARICRVQPDLLLTSRYTMASDVANTAKADEVFPEARQAATLNAVMRSDFSRSETLALACLAAATPPSQPYWTDI